MILACFLAGLLAHVSFASRFVKKAEAALWRIPGYGLVKGLKHPDWPLDPWQGLKRLVLMLVEETARVGGKPVTRMALTA